MTRKTDWTKAASLPPDELARALEEDHDEVDDNPEMTDEELAELRPAAQVLPADVFAALPRRGRPKADVTKEAIKLRIDPVALDAFRATGPGWQTRINDAVVAAARRLKRSA